MEPKSKTLIHTAQTPSPRLLTLSPPLFRFTPLFSIPPHHFLVRKWWDNPNSHTLYISDHHILIPKPQDSNKRRHTFNPRPNPSTLNPQPSTLNPQPATLNPPFHTPNPPVLNHQTLHPKEPSPQNRSDRIGGLIFPPASETPNYIPNLQHLIPDPDLQTLIPKPLSPNPNPQALIPKP